MSEGQFKEMQDAKVQLVVPEELHKAYPKTVQPHLMTLESFLADVRLINLPDGADLRRTGAECHVLWADNASAFLFYFFWPAIRGN